jgi:hypothetical protein
MERVVLRGNWVVFHRGIKVHIRTRVPDVYA